MAEESFVEPNAVLGSVKSSSWKVFHFRVSGENRRNIHCYQTNKDTIKKLMIKNMFFFYSIMCISGVSHTLIIEKRQCIVQFGCTQENFDY